MNMTRRQITGLPAAAVMVTAMLSLIAGCDEGEFDALGPYDTMPSVITPAEDAPGYSRMPGMVDLDYDRDVESQLQPPPAASAAARTTGGSVAAAPATQTPNIYDLQSLLDESDRIAREGDAGQAADPDMDDDLYDEELDGPRRTVVTTESDDMDEFDDDDTFESTSQPGASRAKQITDMIEKIYAEDDTANVEE